MLLCIAGDAHGRLDRMYSDILAFEVQLCLRFDAVLHVGDLGIWPDASCVDRATREHDGVGDFPAWLAAKKQAPRSTYFIKGNHEDFEWLERQQSREILPGLTYLPNGRILDIGGVIVGGIGGCFGPSNYDRPSQDLRGIARRHFTRDEVEAVCQQRGIDILLLHDAPGGVEFAKSHPFHGERRYTSNASGLRTAVLKVKPQICFFGHHHVRLDADVDGVRCVGLNAISYPGSLVAMTIERGAGCTLIGEWPQAAHDS
jgi:predicted phosphodiesterase